MMAHSDILQWKPSQVIGNPSNHASILLNHSLDGAGGCNKELFTRIWNRSKIKVAVDGGVNYLPTIQCAKPDIVSGDFDSIKDELLQQYKQHDNIEIIHTPDQDETDFTKSILILQEKKVNFEFIIAFWSSAGRIDQIFSGINTLIRFHDKPVFLLYSGKSLSWILDKGKHQIQSNSKSKWCSLVPVGNPCLVTTKGFRWNLNGDKLSFGQLISTSNEFDPNENHVFVETDFPLLFSMDISKGY